VPALETAAFANAGHFDDFSQASDQIIRICNL
jgi:hypothetical protein